MTKILGISAFYHDSSAALIKNGEIMAAAQEERFTRIKHDSKFPSNAIKFVLDYTNTNLKDVDYVVFYEKPFLKFERLLETYIALSPKGFTQFSKSMPIWLKDKLFQKKLIKDNLLKIDKEFNAKNKLYFSEHHLSHAASAYYPSNFNEAVVITADGVGEWATTTISIGNGKDLKIEKEIHFPHSLGLLYSAFTYYCGFKVNSGEYKLMGLAPYGSPKFTKLIKENLIEIMDDGSFKLNLKYFDYATGLKMTNTKFDKLFGHKARNSKNEEISQFHMDIAASIQKVTEEVMIKICKSVKSEYKIDNLCLAGGVALNCVANGKILKNKIFKNIWIQPASGDAGGSLGAALAFWHLELKNEKIKSLKSFNSYLGPEYKDYQIEESLKSLNANFKLCNEDEILSKTVNDLDAGKAVGWFQGRMEFGPRALGSRSILGDPRKKDMQKKLNLKIKFRESFRPFAPSVILEKAKDWFDLNVESPYMLLVSNVLENKRINNNINDNLFGIDKLNLVRSEIPAVTHVDYSARIQTVSKESNFLYYKLLEKFYLKTKCPVLINTSFNIRGEPIVNTPEDAYNCFMGSNLDTLIIGNYILEKNQQMQKLNKSYKDNFELD